MSKPSSKRLQQRRRDQAIAAKVILIIAGVTFLVTLGMGFFRLVAAIGLYTFADPTLFGRILAISAGVTLLLLAVYGLLAPDNVRRFFSGRQALYGTNSGILLIAFLGFLVALNILVFRFSPDSLKNIDLTEDKTNSLAPETLQILDALPEPVTAYAFFTADNYQRASAETLLTNFRDSSDGKFRFEIIDPDRDPVMAQQAGVTKDGTIVLLMGERREAVTPPSELNLAAALVRLKDPTPRTVYFLTGHGEYDIRGSGENAIYQAANTLSIKNYAVLPLSLATTSQVPADALAVIIAGPQAALLPAEITALDTYLQSGGALVVLLEPSLFTEIDPLADPLADYLDTSWQIRVSNDLVIDTRAQVISDAIGSDYLAHPVTASLANTMYTVLPTARSLQLQPQTGSVIPTWLVRTDTSAWGETDLAGLLAGDPPSQDENDVPGPITLAAAAEDTASGARVVVIGDAEFAGDALFNEVGNGDLFINSVDWAAEQENLLGLTPRTPTDRSLKFLSGLQMVLLLLGSVCLVPLLVVGAGVAAWLVRRKRG